MRWTYHVRRPICLHHADSRAGAEDNDGEKKERESVKGKRRYIYFRESLPALLPRQIDLILLVIRI